MNSEIKTCPFCGSDPIVGHHSLLAFAVICSGCGATGERAHVPEWNLKDRTMAEIDEILMRWSIRHWNRRN